MNGDDTTKVRRVRRRVQDEGIDALLKEGEERADATRRLTAVCEIAERAFSKGFTSIRVPLDHDDVQAMRFALRDMERVR